MLVQQNPPLHLTYCMNVHPGESWAEVLRALREKTLQVRARVARRGPFGLGLRLGAQAAETLAQPGRLDEFRKALSDNNLYVFTINGFPYGPFHGAGVKAQVYAPDWRAPERRWYTRTLAEILAALLPEDVSGSISTVPGSFKDWVRDEADLQDVVSGLLACAGDLAGIRGRTGREICLAIEPEPGCLIETTDEAVAFFRQHVLGEEDAARHLGVCFDACHAAVQFEDPAAALSWLCESGVRVAKVQLSAALELALGPGAADALGPFEEGTYLHQASLVTPRGEARRWLDLPQVREDLRAGPEAGTLRVHYHVPLHWEGREPLRSTAGLMTPDFFRLLTGGATEHLEIETYTFHVMPEWLRSGDLVDSIAREYAWVLERLRAGA